MKCILGMGNALTDVLATLKDDQILHELELPKGGMTHIGEETFHRVQQLFSEIPTTITVGGSAANACRALAHLGVKTGFIGKVGNDAIGQNYAQSLTRLGIADLMVVSEKLPSGICSAFISPDGERTFGDFMGASLALTADELKPKQMQGYDYLFLEGYLVQNHALIEHAAVLAKEAGMQVVMDLASYNIILQDRDFSRHLVEKYVDVVFANEEEAKALTGKEPEEALHELATMTDIAVVKVGARGSMVQCGDEVSFAKAERVKQVVDTTSAGDHYAAGFLYGLLNGMPLQRCAEIGSTVSAAAIQVIGTELSEEQWRGIKLTIEH